MGERHAVGLGALDRREAGFQAKLLREDAYVLRGVSAAVVRQHLYLFGGAVCTEPTFNRLKQHIPHIRSVRADTSDRWRYRPHSRH